MPYLRVANVFDGWIDYSDVLEMDFTPTERETFSLLPNDLLLNEGQSLELVGRSSMYLGKPNRYCFQNTLVRFRCTPGKRHARPANLSCGGRGEIEESKQSHVTIADVNRRRHTEWFGVSDIRTIGLFTQCCCLTLNGENSRHEVTGRISKRTT